MCVCVCTVVSRVRSHSQQLDVIVAPHRAACRASRSPQHSNDIVKEGGGEGGGLVGDFEIAHDKCYRGIPSSIKQGLSSSHRNKMSYSWTVLQNRSIV